MLSLQLWRRIGSHTTSIVLFSVKTARYAHIPYEWEADNTAFEALFFQNDSICERDYPWRLIGTRGPVNQAVIRRLPQLTYLKYCVTLYELTHFIDIFILFYDLSLV